MLCVPPLLQAAAQAVSQQGAQVGATSLHRGRINLNDRSGIPVLPHLLQEARSTHRIFKSLLLLSVSLARPAVQRCGSSACACALPGAAAAAPAGRAGKHSSWSAASMPCHRCDDIMPCANICQGHLMWMLESCVCRPACPTSLPQPAPVWPFLLPLPSPPSFCSPPSSPCSPSRARGCSPWRTRPAPPWPRRVPFVNGLGSGR